MRLTKEKLYNLIEESMGSRFSPEQEEKILSLIKKAREKLIELEGVTKFFPQIINLVYGYNDEEQPKMFKKFSHLSRYQRMVKDHYRATTRIAEILEEVNQYLVLLRDLEIESQELLKAIEDNLYVGLTGPELDVTKQPAKLEGQLSAMMDTAVVFLEDINLANPSFLKSSNLKSLSDTSEAFEVNYKDLKDYLESSK